MNEAFIYILIAALLGGIAFLIFKLRETKTDLSNALDKANFEKERAKSASDAKAEFLSIISHEIRTPLNGILGMTKLLAETTPNQDQINYIESIDVSGKSLLGIINDVIDISKIELGDTKAEYNAFHLSKFTENIISPFRNLAQEKGVSLNVNTFPKNLEFVVGDQIRLRQILWNILSNAVKFTDEGEVNVTFSRQKIVDGEKISDFDIALKVEVSDTGIGISEHKLDEVFQPFVQEDKIINRVFGGTGIGLTITQKLVDLLSGDISVESEKGVGSTFTIIIPFFFATEEQISGLLNREAGNLDFKIGEGLKILVVEDNVINAEITSEYLKKFGAEVNVVDNGLKAIDSVKQLLPDIVYMDIHMPTMDGIEATKKIRKTIQGSTIPIVGLTADAFSEQRERSLKAGIDCVITKPFSDEQLYETLEKFGKRDRALTRKIGETNPRYVPLQNPVPKVPTHMENLKKDKWSKPLPIGDEENIQKFIKLFGKDKLVPLLNKAPEHLERRMKEIHDGIKEDDLTKVREAAHAIKGTTGQLFALKLSNEAAKIEGNAENIEIVKELLPGLEVLVQETLNWWTSKISED